MTDTPSSILLSREMSTGSNVNLWGGYLITTQRTTERATKGYQAYSVTGDATISWANYSATNDYAVSFIKLNASSLTAAWTHTIPGYQNYFGAWNNSGFAGTIKNSGGTGITVPASRVALLYCDAVDVSEATPNWINNYASTLTNNGDIVVKATLQAAIAAASGLTAPFILNSATDLTPGYLSSKLTTQVSGATTTQLAGLVSLQWSTINPSANEQRALVISPPYVGGFLNGGTKTSQYTPVVGTEYNNDHTSGSWTTNVGGITSPQIGQKIKLNCFGNYPPFLLGTVNGLTNFTLDAGFSGELTYSGASWGWN